MNFALQVAQSVPRKRDKLHAILDSLPKLPETARCLDIGTNHGGLAYFYSPRGDWTFLDIDEMNLRAAQEVLKGQFVASDADSYLERVGPGHFALITCIDTFMYFPDHSKTLDRIQHSLAPGGYFLVTGVDHDVQTDPLIRIRHRLGIESAMAFRNQYGSQAMSDLLRKHGLEPITVRRFCGPLTQIFQTTLDYLISSPDKPAGDRLTQGVNREKSDRTRQKPSLTILRFLSRICLALDRLLFWMPRYGYVIVAQKPRPT